MSLGLPIVASDVGGVGEAVVDGESGLLVPARAEHALADALSAMLDDRDGATRMGQMAQRQANRRFTLTAMTDGMADVYSEVAPQRPKTGMRIPSGSAA